MRSKRCAVPLVVWLLACSRETPPPKFETQSIPTDTPRDTVTVIDSARLRVVRDSLRGGIAQREAVIAALRDTIAQLRSARRSVDTAPAPPPEPPPAAPRAAPDPPLVRIPEVPSGYAPSVRWSGDPAPPAGWPTGWAGSVPGSVTVVQDPTAPASAPAVAQITYPNGFRSGDEPQTWEYKGTSGARAVTYTYWFKYSSGFDGEESSVNKHVFVFATDGSVIGYTAMRFSGTATTGYLDWLFQEGATGSTRNTWLATNRPMVRLDQWHRVTVEVAAPVVRMWLDGVLVGSRTNASLKTIGVMKVAPTWGGNTGDRMSGTGRLFLDELQVRTK